MKRLIITIIVLLVLGVGFYHFREEAKRRAIEEIANSATTLPPGTYEKWSRAINTGVERYLRYSENRVFVTDPDIGSTNTYSIGVGRPSCDPWGPDVMIVFEQGNSFDLISLAGFMNDDEDLHFEEIAPGVGPFSPAAERLMADLCFELARALDGAGSPKPSTQTFH